MTFYLPDPLQDVGGEGGHPRRTARELHQHGEQLEEGIGRLAEGEHRVSVCVCFSGAPSGRRRERTVVLTSGVSLAMDVKSIDTICREEEEKL